MSIVQADTFHDLGPTVWYVDWPEQHCDGPLGNHQLVMELDDAGAIYELEAPAVRIEVQKPAQISRCSLAPGLFRGNLPDGESVLLADNVIDRPPLHLRFTQPLRAVGACVTATAPQAAKYWAQCHLLLSNGQRFSLQPREAELNTSGQGAPFMGGRAARGLTIHEIWFDALDLSSTGEPVPDAQSQFLQVGIGDLCLIPA